MTHQRGVEPPERKSGWEAKRQYKTLTDDMVIVLSAMARGTHLKEDLHADTQGITCGKTVVAKSVLKGLVKRGHIDHDRGWPVRKYRLKEEPKR